MALRERGTLGKNYTSKICMCVFKENHAKLIMLIDTVKYLNNSPDLGGF